MFYVLGRNRSQVCSVKRCIEDRLLLNDAFVAVGML